MATKAQSVSSGAPTVVVGTATANLGHPQLQTGTAGSRVPSANLEATIVGKKEALEKVAKAINAGSISVRRAADGGGRCKVHPSEVSTVLAALLS